VLGTQNIGSEKYQIYSVEKSNEASAKGDIKYLFTRTRVIDVCHLDDLPIELKKAVNQTSGVSPPTPWRATCGQA